MHYKNSRYFLTGILGSNKIDRETSDIDDYAIGQAEDKYLEGTFKDAEDGVLYKNPVAQRWCACCYCHDKCRLSRIYKAFLHILQERTMVGRLYASQVQS